MEFKEFLAHHGVKGMKWGQHLQALSTTESSRISVRLHPRAPLPKTDKEKASLEAAVRETARVHDKAMTTAIHSLNHGEAQKLLSDKSKPSPERLREVGKLLKKQMDDLDSNYEHEIGFNNEGHIMVVTSPKGLPMTHAAMPTNMHAIKSTIELHYDEQGNYLGASISQGAAEHSEVLEDFLEHHGVKGMKWGVRRTLQQLHPSERAAYLKQKDAKWLAKVEANPKLGKISAKAARESKKLTKKLKQDYKDRGINIKKDPIQRNRYDAELKNILETSLDKAAYKVHKYPPSRLLEVQIHRHPDGTITSMLSVRHNTKIVKQQSKIAKADQRRVKQEAKAQAKADAAAHDDMSLDQPDDFEGLQFTMPVDEEGFVEDVTVDGLTHELFEFEDYLMHNAADGGAGNFDESKVKRDKGGKFSKKEELNLKDLKLEDLTPKQLQKLLDGNWERIAEGLGRSLIQNNGDFLEKELKAKGVDFKKMPEKELWSAVAEVMNTSPRIARDTVSPSGTQKLHYSYSEKHKILQVHPAPYNGPNPHPEVTRTLFQNARFIQKVNRQASQPRDEPMFNPSATLDTSRMHDQGDATHDDLSELEGFLAHFGIRGMKWGVRRDVGSDGLVDKSSEGTPTRSVHSPGGMDGDPNTSTDHERAVKALAKANERGTSALSNEELALVKKRIEAERNFNSLTTDQRSELQKKVDELKLMEDYRKYKAKDVEARKSTGRRLMDSLMKSATDAAISAASDYGKTMVSEMFGGTDNKGKSSNNDPKGTTGQKGGKSSKSSKNYKPKPINVNPSKVKVTATPIDDVIKRATAKSQVKK